MAHGYLGDRNTWQNKEVIMKPLVQRYTTAHNKKMKWQQEREINIQIVVVCWTACSGACSLSVAGVEIMFFFFIFILVIVSCHIT